MEGLSHAGARGEGVSEKAGDGGDGVGGRREGKTLERAEKGHRYELLKCETGKIA